MRDRSEAMLTHGTLGKVLVIAWAIAGCTDGGLEEVDGGPSIADGGMGEIDGGPPIVDGGFPGTDASPLRGFVGSPCDDVSDCDYRDAVCLEDGFPGGSCSSPCELYCPDRDDYPMTFCVDYSELPPAGAALGNGACFSRCDFLVFPGNGCRAGYGCVEVARANQPDVLKFACLPGEETVLTDCQRQLVDAGVGFEPTTIPDESPASHPGLTCHIEDPVYLLSPVHGVALLNSDGSASAPVLLSCEGALAVAATAADIGEYRASGLMHMGTYNCRVVSGTDTLSRHAFADAIDIAGVVLSDGTTYTLVDDWEHDTDSPTTEAGLYLYEAAQRWYDNMIWRIILTPNFNSAHDDHFHIDMTPGPPFLGRATDLGMHPSFFDD